MMDRKSLNVAAAGILQACDAAGEMGAPGGHLYAGLMASGYTFEQYERIMSALVQAGTLTKRGECYKLTAKGRALNDQVSAAIAAHKQRRAA